MIHDDFSSLPIIDVGPLVAGSAEKQVVAGQIDAACRQCGFFYVIGHGVDAGLQHDLQSLAREFFARPTAEKMQIAMIRGGKTWRGLELLAQTNPALILSPEAVVFLILQGYMFVHTVAMGLDEPVDRIGMGTTAECARFFGHSG